jgi:hypothetical protein
MMHRIPRRSRRQLDDLLAGNGPAGDPVTRVLGAAAAPATAGELDGLSGAVAAFAAPPTLPAGSIVTQRRGVPAVIGAARRMLALRLLAILAGSAAVGGVAYAAASGPLSSPSAGSAASRAHAADPRTGASIGVPAWTRAGTHPASAASSAVSRARGTAGHRQPAAPAGSPSPSPSLRGLCVAWLAQPSRNASMAVDPAFTALVRAAGSASGVAGYCTELLTTATPSHPVTGRPSTLPAPATSQPQSGQSGPSSPAGSSNSSHGHRPHPSRSADLRSAVPAR